ncbi:PREDICTED: phosphopantothenoylcysteine decarboxylase subunit VHS3-like [Wasmannia auropunctata]|uniref:phosphopantothenoylcysteine decarboxylase subunit VHS3-like n=1 Tax=Wasmannia auropunctata TaxID=64793 RepID=UPI0005EFDDFA|nr:PREDICTED: phosphopantothenoylcysteine decarboxylase subunit VHS3-like [Wasmannia auropunctata]
MAAAGLALAKHYRRPGSYRPTKICVDRVNEQDRFERWLREKTRNELIDMILEEPIIVRQLSRRESECPDRRGDANEHDVRTRHYADYHDDDDDDDPEDPRADHDDDDDDDPEDPRDDDCANDDSDYAVE